jgi:hypothetical protein
MEEQGGSKEVDKARSIHTPSTSRGRPMAEALWTQTYDIDRGSCGRERSGPSEKSTIGE